MSDTNDAISAAAESYEAPPPPPEPEPEEVDIDETAETFPREVVEKLRQENAKWRTRTREVESAFEGYSPAEKERFLELAHQLSTDPEGAYTEFAAVTDRLAKQLGKEQPVVSEEAAPAEEPAPEPDSGPAALTAEDIEKMVADRIAAERAAAENEQRVNATLAEAEGLGDAYKTQAGKAFLLALAQEANTDLEGAHKVHEELLQQVRDEAIAEYRKGLRSGQHPPRLPAGDPTAPGTSGPPKTLAEARKAMEERLGATYGD